jgi:hypothetical protein
MKLMVMDMDNLVNVMCDYVDVAQELAANIEADIQSPDRKISSGTVLALSKLVSVGNGLDKMLAIVERKGNKEH